MLDENFWVKKFDITINDLERIINFIEEAGSPVSIVDISKRIIIGRLKYGEDLSPAVLSNWSGKDSIRLWDPAADWEKNDNVIVLVSSYDSGNIKHQLVIGVIKEINLEKNFVCVRSDGKEIKYELAEPNSEKAIKWHNFVRQTVAKFASSSTLEDRVIAVFTEFGGKIASRLQEVLITDNRFINLGQFWFQTKLVEDIPQTALIELYSIITSSNYPLSLDTIINKIQPTKSEELIQKFKIKKALLTNPILFTKHETEEGITYQVHIPDIDHMQIVNYAYDPETYEIICSPGEKPTQKTIDKLTEYGLLAGVISNQTEVINGT